MGFTFSNNWYSYATAFPTMESHVDVIGHVYFTGLHQEIKNIENCLGLSPVGSFATVKARLDNSDSVLSGKYDKTGGNISGAVGIQTYTLEGDFQIQDHKYIKYLEFTGFYGAAKNIFSITFDRPTGAAIIKIICTGNIHAVGRKYFIEEWHTINENDTYNTTTLIQRTGNYSSIATENVTTKKTTFSITCNADQPSNFFFMIEVTGLSSLYDSGSEGVAFTSEV